MKFGFRSASLGLDDIADALRDLAAMGFDGVEVCLEPAPLRPGTLTRDGAEQIRATADALGLAITSASFHADMEDMDVRLRQTFQALDVAEWLGTDVLVVNTERAATDAAEAERQFAEVAERMKRLCELAEARGIRIAIEPEPLFVIGNIDDMLRIADAVSSPALRVNLDIGHAEVTEGDVPGAIERLGDLIVHTHLEDIAGRVHKHLIPGEGNIDFAAVFAAFDRVGYRGIHTIDLFGLGDRAADSARAALAALRRLAADA
jgi:sugar phosphate isomerase/epimerase